jgi:hypothetical protein
MNKLQLLVFASVSVGIAACGGAPGTNEDTANVGEAVLAGANTPNNCGGYQDDLNDLYAKYAYVFSSACVPLTDTSVLVPALSPLPWTCCKTANGPLCAGRNTLVENADQTSMMCKGGTQDVLVTANEDHHRIRVYNTQNKLTYRREHSLTAGSFRKTMFVNKQDQSDPAFEDWVLTLRLAVPGDLTTATETDNGLSQRIADDNGNTVWIENGRVDIDPTGNPTIKCGTFSWDNDQDLNNALSRVCTSLDSKL